MRHAPVLAMVLAACGGGTRAQYLGAEIPAVCEARDAEACLGWMLERDLAAAELGIYDDGALRAYVQSVVERLARAAHLAVAPRVVIAVQDETYATAGRRIVLARSTLEKLSSEAELAAIIAHELAHIEARHVMVSLFGRPRGRIAAADRRDAEAIADERAVWLLERAGYAPAAMARALDAVLAREDRGADADPEAEHPPRATRIARVAALAGGRGGFEGRAELLDRLDRMVVGRDPRLGRRVDDAWVVPALGLAISLAPGDQLRADDDLLVVRRGGATLAAYAVGTPWARELAATLDEPAAADTALGPVALGIAPARPAAPAESPLARLVHAIRASLPQPSAGARVAIVARARGALVVELRGASELAGLGLREATASELASAVPVRLAVERAPRAGTLAELDACPGRLLDAPTRQVAAGEPIKCADRPIAVQSPR